MYLPDTSYVKIYTDALSVIYHKYNNCKTGYPKM